MNCLFIVCRRSGWDFAPGEQVFEHYGQPNHIYFMYHGFVLPLNEFDCVQIEIAPTAEEAREVGGALTRTPSLKEVLQVRRTRFPSCLFMRHC